ncbi:MAG: hypothetical protein WCG55_02635 [bacterium]
MDAPTQKAVRSSRSNVTAFLFIIIGLAIVASVIVFLKKTTNNNQAQKADLHAGIINQIATDSTQGDLSTKEKTDILKQVSKNTPVTSAQDRAAILDSISKASTQ